MKGESKKKDTVTDCKKFIAGEGKKCSHADLNDRPRDGLEKY